MAQVLNISTLQLSEVETSNVSLLKGYRPGADYALFLYVPLPWICHMNLVQNNETLLGQKHSMGK